MVSDRIEVGRSFSRDVVQFLRNTRTLKEIGRLIGRSESFVSLVGKGKRSLTINHLLKLEKVLGEPLPLIILEASKECLSNDMRPQYDALHKILKKSVKLRKL